MNRHELMHRLSRQPDWRATLMILTSVFPEDFRVWRHVNLDREEIAFKKILADGTFSAGERILLSVAASLFNQEQRVNLWEVFNKLDEQNTALVLEAIQSFCQRPPGRENFLTDFPRKNTHSI